jgi:hypothetical protein
MNLMPMLHSRGQFGGVARTGWRPRMRAGAFATGGPA